MTISPQMSWKSASSLEDCKLEPATLGYFHSLAQDEAHELVLSIFQELSQEQGVTRAFLSRRLDKSPEQITRWLSAPGNWTLDTFANLLLAMGYKPKFDVEKLSEMRQSNHHHPAASKVPDTGLRLLVSPDNDLHYRVSTRIDDGASRTNEVKYQF